MKHMKYEQANVLLRHLTYISWLLCLNWNLKSFIDIDFCFSFPSFTFEERGGKKRCPLITNVVNRVKSFPQSL